MSKNLLIVESPAKAKTLKKYLGSDFEILASYGHVRDLIPKEGAVEPDADFAMHYQVLQKNEKHVDNICRAIKKANALYLASDPDREGEAIAWHLLELIKERVDMSEKQIYRVVFHEITKNAILDAIKSPRDLSQDLIEAQQARRALDYLVGFNLSPLLWKKIRRGLSAGRVQSPALRLIVERQNEIDKFEPKEYWSVIAEHEAKKKSFSSALHIYEGEKQSQFSVVNGEQAGLVKETLLKESNGKLKVLEVKKSKRKRNPSPPFITSTLQQEASRKLYFSAQKTMRVAQQLYEGIDTNEGLIGLITYMRTDSVSLSNEAVNDIRDLIEANYGKDYLPDSPNIYKTKSKNAQEAHEAIRPTFVHMTPKALKGSLSSDQYKLYNLIWKRAVACQMNQALYNVVSLQLSCGDNNEYVFKSTGSTIEFLGFLKVYEESKDDSKDEVSLGDNERILPSLEKGDIIDVKEINITQHFTEPPPKFTEASLVKTLEEYGIGRPSTYATIISTLQQRDYVSLEKRRFFPTDVGVVVSKFLSNYFQSYVGYDFTAQLENDLDDIANGSKQWKPVLENFWSPFIKLIKETEENVSREDVTQEKIDEKCPECNTQLSIRLGRNGRFIGCTGYPDCSYTRSMDDSPGESSEPEVVADRKCPKCSKDLLIRKGKYGKFIGCSGYPECKFIESLEKPEDTGVKCPECHKDNLYKRKSRYGKYFYSCNTYPKCKYAVNNEPISETCPECSWPVLVLKTTKKKGLEKMCPQKSCKYSESS